MTPRGVVQRMVYPEGGLPFIEYRSRDLGALFADAEWGWTREKCARYVFASYGPAAGDCAKSAEDHATMLRRGGEAHAYAVVFGSDAEALARGVTPAAKIVVLPEPEFEEAGPPPRRTLPARKRREIDPAEVFAREEARHLA